MTQNTQQMLSLSYVIDSAVVLEPEQRSVGGFNLTWLVAVSIA
jgi:hypothetical protein